MFSSGDTSDCTTRVSVEIEVFLIFTCSVFIVFQLSMFRALKGTAQNQIKSTVSSCI